MYTTQNNKQREIERQLDGAEEEVAKADVYNLQKLDREIVRQTGGGVGGGGGRYRQMYTIQNNRQRENERKLDRQEEVATDRCIQLRTIDREIVRQTGVGGMYRQMYTTQINR